MVTFFLGFSLLYSKCSLLPNFHDFHVSSEHRFAIQPFHLGKADETRNYLCLVQHSLWTKYQHLCASGWNYYLHISPCKWTCWECHCSMLSHLLTTWILEQFCEQRKHYNQVLPLQCSVFDSFLVELSLQTSQRRFSPEVQHQTQYQRTLGLIADSNWLQRTAASSKILFLYLLILLAF